MLRGKFIAISAYIKKNTKTETFQINNLIMLLKPLEKQEQRGIQDGDYREEAGSVSSINKKSC
jgi:hypothetical protein